MDIQLVSYNSFFIGIINLLLSDSLIQSTFMYGILIAIAHSAHMDMKLLFEKKNQYMQLEQLQSFLSFSKVSFQKLMCHFIYNVTIINDYLVLSYLMYLKLYIYTGR